MIKQYFQQAWAQLRQNPIISVVNVTGTALAIFLIMLVVMVQQVQVEPFAPESNRDRFLHVRCGSITNENWGEGDSSNGPISVRSAKEMYKSLTTPEAVTLYTIGTTSTPVNVPNQPATAVDVKETDDDYWRVFDFAFTDGKPYDRATFDAGQPVAVITESVARLLFGSTKVAGREFLLAHAPYRGGARCVYPCHHGLRPGVDTLYFDRPGEQYMDGRPDGVDVLHHSGEEPCRLPRHPQGV